MRTLNAPDRERLAQEFTQGFVREGGLWGRVRTETDALDLVWWTLAMVTAAHLLQRPRSPREPLRHPTT